MSYLEVIGNYGIGLAFHLPEDDRAELFICELVEQMSELVSLLRYRAWVRLSADKLLENCVIHIGIACRRTEAFLDATEITYFPAFMLLQIDGFASCDYEEDLTDRFDPLIEEIVRYPRQLDHLPLVG